MANKKQKIVYLASTLSKTGPINVLYNLIKYLDKNKFDITVITLSPENSIHSRFQNFIDLGIEVKSLNLSRLKGYLYGGFKLKKIIDKISPDIVHSQCFRTNLFSALFLGKYKRCSTVHCDYRIDFTSLYGKQLGLLMFILNHISLYFLKNNICCSEILAEMLNKKYKYMKFSYVNNGIDTEIFKPIEDKYKLRQKLNLPTNKKIFIWVGAFIKIKNPILLVNYIKEVDKNNLYIFCGDGPLLSICKHLLAEQDNVIFTGNINNIIQYLQASDFYLSTSLSEGLPMSVIEAQACGLYCILSDIPQHKLIELKNNSLTNLYKQNDIADLQICINKTQALKENIISDFNSEFDAKNMSKKYEELYDNIIEF